MRFGPEVPLSSVGVAPMSVVFTGFAVLFGSAPCVRHPVVSLGPGTKSSMSSVLQSFDIVTQDPFPVPAGQGLGKAAP